MKVPAWVQDTIERAIKTAAQFVIVAVGGNLTNAWSLDWQMVTGAALAGALTSVLTSAASVRIGNSGTASMTSAVEPANDPPSSGRHARPEEPEVPDEPDAADGESRSSDGPW